MSNKSKIETAAKEVLEFLSAKGLTLLEAGDVLFKAGVTTNNEMRSLCQAQLLSECINGNECTPKDS